MMAKILLVEDNKQIADNIKTYLELENEFEVISCDDGENGLFLAKTNDYDAILLDLMLPWIDGKTICRKLRNEKNTPVIIITAKSQLEDKLDLFEVGADDYLVKPFDLEELLARLKAVLRRGLIEQVFTFQNIEINFPKKRVFKSKKEVHLTLKEFQILEILVQNRGVSMSRTDLITYLRGEDSIRDSDEKLDVYICNIRKKLDKNLIETVKGFGYRIWEEE